MQRFFRALTLILTLFLLPAFPVNTAHAGAPPARYVVLLGDFLPGASAQGTIEKRGYHYLFDGIRPYLGHTDTLFLNLETPLSTRGEAHAEKKYTFRSSPEVAPVLKAEKVHAVTLANNHILDFGHDALADTENHLENAGVAHTGTGRSWADALRPAEVVTPLGPVRFVAFSNTLPKSYWARGSAPGTLYGSEKAVRRAVAGAAAGAAPGTPVLAVFHWSAELLAEPKEYQYSLARLAIDSGAALVVGHHPHVPQPIEVYKGAPILYSLGNFSFGSWSRRTPVGLMAIAEIGADGRCAALEVFPLATDNNVVRFSPRPITGEEGKMIFEELVSGIGRDQAAVYWQGDRGVIRILK